jgi:hypothetical protein
MSPEERGKISLLVRHIQDEHNPKTFTQLVEELNELLERVRKSRSGPSVYSGANVRLFVALIRQSRDAISKSQKVKQQTRELLKQCSSRSAL